MTLLNTLLNLNNSCDVVGLAGHVNVETGSLEISAAPSPGRCDECIHYQGFARECQSCGREAGSNASFLAGLGDGVYPAFCFYSERGAALLGAVWIFDEGNRLAEATSFMADPEKLSTDLFREVLLPHLGDYESLPGLIVAEIDAVESWISAQDPNWEPGADAVLSLPFSGGARYSLALFFEAALDSPTIAIFARAGGNTDNITGGFDQSLRPRAAILVDSAVAHTLFDLEPQSGLSNHDWAVQFDAWENSFQNSNVNSNGPQCARFNGLLWSSFLQRQESLGDDMPDLYVSEALGWNVQAALAGFSKSQGLIDSIYRNYRDTVEKVTLETICSIRGFEVDSEVRKLLPVSEAKRPREKSPAPTEAKFCSQCGRRFAEKERFCPACGGQRQ